MSVLNYPNIIQNGQPADGDKLQENLNVIKSIINGDIDWDNIKASLVNAANGIVKLDANAKVPMEQLLTNVANGTVKLDENALIPLAQIPNLQNTNKVFPSGTKAIFVQATAPTGWTQDTSQNDRVLRVVSGSGGGTGGSWTITGLSSSTTGSHSHTVNNHTHSIPRSGWGEALAEVSGYLRTSYSTASLTIASRDQTSGGSSPGTSSAGSHSHTISQDGNWRPSYWDCIVCTKD